MGKGGGGGGGGCVLLKPGKGGEVGEGKNGCKGKERLRIAEERDMWGGFVREEGWTKERGEDKGGMEKFSGLWLWL